MKRFFKKIILPIFTITLLVPLISINTASAADTETAWNNSQEIEFASSGAGDMASYYFDVPVGTSELNFDMYTWTGAAEIYVRQGSAPTISAYDAMDDTIVNNKLEITPITNPAAGTWYFGIYSTVGTEDGWAYPRAALSDGVWTTPIDILNNDCFEYYIPGVIPGSSVTGTTTGGASGDVDIDVYDIDYIDECYSDSGAADETCTINPTTQSGNYYLYSCAYADTPGFSVKFDVVAGAPPPPSTAILNGEGGTTGEIIDTEYEYFNISTPIGASDLYITSSGGTGTSADLYEIAGPTAPTTSSNDNNSVTPSTNTESILVPFPLIGIHQIGIYANGGTVNTVGLTANYAEGTLSKGVNETGLTVAEDEWKHFNFVVPTGATDLTLTTSGGSGNVDLYTRVGDTANGEYPTTTTNDGSDTGAGTSKSITDATPSVANYIVSIKGGTGGASNVTLNANYTPDVPSTSMFNGQKITGISALSGEYKYYDVTVPSGAEELDGVTDDDLTPVATRYPNVQLYERFGDAPTTSTYDQSGIQWGAEANQEFITVDVPTAGTHYFGLYAFPGSDFSQVNFQTRWVNSYLTKGVDEGSVTTSNNGEWAIYAIEIPNSLGDISNLEITTSGGTGDLSLYVEEDDWPTTSATYSSETVSTNAESVSIAAPTKGYVYYIGLYSPTTFSGVTVNADYTEVEGDWVLDNISSDGYSSAVDIDSNSDDYDFAMASDGSNTWFYKRNGRDWAKMNPTSGLGFGSDEVAISENQAYVTNGANIEMYTRTNDTWSSAGNVAAGSLADAAGDLVVSTSNGGTISVYNCPAGVCSSYGTITDPGEANGESWGYSIATDGNKIIVGDPYYDLNPGISNDAGKVYVYAYSGGWSLEDSFMASDASDSGQFGVAVDIDNAELVVGSKYGEINCGGVCGTRNGTIYTFTESGGNWTEELEIEHSDATNTGGSSGDSFGSAVAIQGNYIISSAATHNTGFDARWYIFEKGGTSCAEAWCEIVNYSPESGFDFGQSVAITGNWYYGIGGNTSGSGPGLIILNNNPTGADGDGPSGGGGAVPEFHEYLLMIAIAVVLYFMYKKLPSISGGPISRA